jgi:hypothetical protein
MSEREIRRIVRSVCVDLDERARRAARSTVRQVVLPTAVGVGLAVSGCYDTGDRDSSNQTTDGSVAPDSSSGGTGGAAGVGGGSGESGYGGAAPAYMAPDPDAGPILEYMAPDPDGGPMEPDAAYDGGPVQPPPDAGVQPLYAAPVDAGPVPEYAAPSDSGPVPPYMAPEPDAGPQPDYMGPDPGR